MVVLLNYREDGTTPYVAIWKHGVKETKSKSAQYMYNSVYMVSIYRVYYL